MSAGVTIRGLAKRYGATAAVRDVDLDAVPGQITGLLGRNGAGKTTTLECLLGLRRPDAGSISVAGTDALADPAAAKRLLGAQLQATALQDQLTPREALRFFASFYRNPLRPDDLLARFDLSSKADAAFVTLSRGQQQRLALALSVVNDPPVLVLDEPTAGLDPHARRHLHGLIADLRRAGRTVLMSTHDIAEAERLCDRVAVLHGGRVVLAGPPAGLVAAAAVPPVVTVRTAGPLPTAPGEPLPDGAGYRVPTSDVARTVAAISAACVTHGVALLDVRITNASLEDVFLQATGGPA